MAGVVGTEDLRRTGVFALQTLAVAGGYYAAGLLGLLRDLVVEGAVFTPIWPPTGVAVACLLILGPRVLPGIALGVLLVILHITAFRPDVLANLAGNTLAPLCAYLLLRRVGFRIDLSRLRDGLALVFLGALASMLISSTVGVGILVVTGRLDAGSFWPVWLAWWVGDAMGVLIVTPLLLLLYRARLPLPMGRWKEALALTAITCVVVPTATRDEASLLFLVYPLLIWAALRFLLVGSMLCALFTSVMATVAATDVIGPFAGLSSIDVMIKLQAFNGTMAMIALLLSAVITEQRNTRRSVEQACQELVEVLEHLTAGDTPRAQPTRDMDGGYRPDRAARDHGEGDGPPGETGGGGLPGRPAGEGGGGDLHDRPPRDMSDGDLPGPPPGDTDGGDRPDRP